MTIRTALAMPVVAACTVSMCSCALADHPKVEKEIDLTVAHVEGQSLRVDGRNGSISIAPTSGEQVEIHAKLQGPNRERVESAVIRADRLDDGSLHVWAEWETERKNNEGVAFSILIPDTTGIFADTSNGSITISNLTGPYDLGTSNGPVKIVQAVGDARVDTSNGSINISGNPGLVHADTSNGSISISGASGEVVTDSSNGNIEISLTDANPGPVVADTSNGSITVVVGPAFDGSMVADTSNGRVRFGPFPAGYNAQVTQSDKDLARAVFGPSAHKSRLDTSNGSITVRPAAGG